MDLLASSDSDEGGTFIGKGPLGNGVSKKNQKAKLPCKTASADAKVNKKGSKEQDQLVINKKYATAFEQRKKREELSQNKDIIEDDTSDSSSEDEDAVLLTKKVQEKIFLTLKKIKQKDPTLYSSQNDWFDESDFADSGVNNATQEEAVKPKSLIYSDFLRNSLIKDGPSAFAKEAELTSKKLVQPDEVMSYKAQQDLLKSQFLAAADLDLDGKEADFLELSKENCLEGVQPTELGNDTTDDIMRHYWASDEQLDEKEIFLRDYILNNGWKNSIEDAEPRKTRLTTIDDREEQHLAEVDKYEAAYNFRYEEEGGSKIQGYARNTPGSVRLKNEKRKRQRDNKKSRVEEEKLRKREELKRLKNLKKAEILERIQKIEKISGREDIGNMIDLDEDFDPEKHNTAMQAIFNEEYDEAEEILRKKELLKPPTEFEEIVEFTETAEVSGKKMLKQQRRLARYFSRKRGAVLDDGLPYAPVANGENPADSGAAASEIEGQQPSSLEQDGDAGNSAYTGLDYEWWMCDVCGTGIPEGQKRFDCSTCKDYTLCRSCYNLKQHPHRFLSKKVPQGHGPPKSFVAPELSSASAYLDEYFQLNYEDIIGGDLPTRFKYSEVQKENYGFDISEILEKTDAELNSVASLKKLAPYRSSSKAGTKKYAEEPKSPRDQYTKSNVKERKSLPNKFSGSRGHSNKRGSRLNALPEDRLQAYGLTRGS